MVGLEQIGEMAGKAAALPRIERYELDCQPRRRPNWTASQGELTGCGWINRFSKLADDAETAHCGFVKRSVFFAVEHKERRIAAGGRGGSVRALGVSSPQRWPSVPDIPAIAETVPGYESSVFYGMSAPRGTPPEIIDILNKAVNVALKDPKLVARLADLKIWRGVYDDGVSFGLDTFVERADLDSQNEYNIACAVATLWGGKSSETWLLEPAPFCFGDLCIFEQLAIDAQTASHSQATWTIVNSLLQRVCRRGVAAIILKAFPLEYEGNTTKENEAAFERRQRALVRLYQRRLGFEPVSDPSLNREGWMLKLINDGAEPKRFKRY
ncbi:hypothetical protein V1289_004651 [Bradyrhizobium sp. AZCC 2289]